MATETITLDPHEFMPSRTELGLDDIGLTIMGEPDWGDAEQDLFLIRKEKGEIPSDRHPPNRNVTIQLMAAKEGATNLSAAALKLQKKVGILQAEGGFVRRDLDLTDGFPNAVATRVHGANLSGISGWMMAHRHAAKDITLTLVTDPYFYGIAEQESAKTSVVNGFELKWELAEVKGTVPGLMRVTVKNEDASVWRSMIAAIESRDNPQDATAGTTADLAYAATALTREAGTTESEREGVKVVRKEKLSIVWQTIISSKITGVGHMTHVGPRRFWVRLFDPAGSPGEVELRLEWRAQGANNWVQNAAVPTKGAGGFTELDLGECRPEAQILGSRKWEWRITAKWNSNGVGSGPTLDLHRVWPLPCEQFMSAVKKPEVPTANLYLVKDLFKEATGALNAKKEEVAGREWETSGETTDFEEISTGRYAMRKKANDTGSRRKALVKTAEITDGVVQMVIERPVFAAGNNGLSQVLLSRGTIGLVARHFTTESGGVKTEETWLEGEIAESAKVLAKLPLITANVPYLLTLVTVGNSAFGWLTKENEPFGEPDVVWDITGTAKGRVGFAERSGLLAEGERRYSNFRAWELEADALCYAGRSIEARSEGLFRQHKEEEIWARLIPDGFLFYAPPSGLEGRKAKGIIIPSFGDLGALPNKGPHSASVIIHHFPGYHFTP